MKSRINELSIIQETSIELSHFGKVELVYMTAEFAPFSNQQKPDLKFIPKNSLEVYFVEYKSSPKFATSSNYFESIIEHKNFIDSDVPVNYAYATDENIDPEQRKVLETNDITVFTSIFSKDDLLDSILKWIK